MGQEYFGDGFYKIKKVWKYWKKMMMMIKWTEEPVGGSSKKHVTEISLFIG